MAAMKIKKGDRVVILAGKDKGKEGVVTRTLPKRGKVVVDGMNVAQKHQKPASATTVGGIIDKEMPLPASTVAVVSPKDGKATRVGFKIEPDGTKIRICKRTGAEIK